MPFQQLVLQALSTNEQKMCESAFSRKLYSSYTAKKLRSENRQGFSEQWQDFEMHFQSWFVALRHPWGKRCVCFWHRYARRFFVWDGTLVVWIRWAVYKARLTTLRRRFLCQEEQTKEGERAGRLTGVKQKKRELQEGMGRFPSQQYVVERVSFLQVSCGSSGVWIKDVSHILQRHEIISQTLHFFWKEKVHNWKENVKSLQSTHMGVSDFLKTSVTQYFSIIFIRRNSSGLRQQQKTLNVLKVAKLKLCNGILDHFGNFCLLTGLQVNFAK